MSCGFVGIQTESAEDRGYDGSRFAEMRQALFENPYQKIWGAPGEPPLPNYQTPFKSLLRGIPPCGRHFIFRQITEREVDSGADLRWGQDRKGYRRLLHPNGICLTGLWSITEDTPYSGYFHKGSQALIVGRYSTGTDARRARTRTLAMVGKLYPTADENHATPLRTANFMTQQDLGGEQSYYINDAELRNAPNTTAWRRGFGAVALALEGMVFGAVDKKPSIRQLYPIAELGKPWDEPTRAPLYMRLLVAPEQPRIEGADLDFRDEIMAQIYDRGDPQPKRTLTFNIELTDDGETRGPSFYERRTFRNWRHVGKITFNAAVASYNGDFVTQFGHPTWRDDPNNPRTATRLYGRKIR